MSAVYTVPSVNCGVTPTAFAYQWVGLDGDTDGTVEQDGVASFCFNGSPSYLAWWEMYPAALQEQFSLNAGDAVQSSVTYSGGNYILALTDITSGQTFSTAQACASTCNRTSAEVITEGYPSSPYGGTADFGAENYSSIRVGNPNNHKGGMTDPAWTTDESIAQGASGTDAQPGALYLTSNPVSPKMSAFTDNWVAEN